MHDSSPIIAPINSNSQQSQRQVLNMVNIPDNEKLSTTTIRGNEPDQSNQPPPCHLETTSMADLEGEL